MQKMIGRYQEMEGKTCVVWDDDREDAVTGVFDRYVSGARDRRRSGYRLIGQSPLGDAFKNIDFPDYPGFAHTTNDRMSSRRP